MTSSDYFPAVDADASAGPAIVRVAPAPGGGDPLVAEYVSRFRATCAVRTIAWMWVLIGALGAVIGGAIGSRLAGIAPALDDAQSPLVRLVNDWFGNPWWCIAGMAAATVITGALGVWLNRRRIPAGQEPWMGFTLVAFAYLLLFDPVAFLGVFTGVVCLVYLAAILFRLLAVALGGDHGARAEALTEPAGGWPLYTVLVPLYRERNVARNILASLAKLDYPHDRLEVKFLLEADDADTLEALVSAGIPAHAEIVIVPLAQPKTKPRACNHGLARARGEFLVIFDAEDRPDADQLKQAVLAFRGASENVVCFQAQLAYHNHRQNLLTRWFALEYNVWFRRYLAGLVRLGTPIPLGGTSNHFRTDALRTLGGWDPFNVTEDCDLGVRLAMSGAATRTLDSTTWEEATSRVGNWLRQRSRWLKGYLVTHLVWSRRPLHLLRTLGPWPTLGFFLSVFCVAALSAFNVVLWLVTGVYAVLATIDWHHGFSLWEIVATRDIEHQRLSWQVVFAGPGEGPVLGTLSVVFAVAAVALFAGNIAFILLAALAGRRPGQRGMWWAALSSPLYWWLIAFAAWKGIWQLLVKPHYWEKTVHGLDQHE